METKLQEIIDRINDLTHEEWAASSIKPADVFYLIERVKEYSSLLKTLEDMHK